MTDSLRVVQLVQQRQLRGAEVFAADLSAELVNRGNDVDSVFLYPGALTQPDDRVVGATKTHALEKALGFHPPTLRRLLAVLRDLDPQVVQANGARTLKYGSLAKRLTRVRFRLVYRSIGDPAVWVRGRGRRFAYRSVFMPPVDGIAAVSSNTLEGLRDLYDLRGKSVRQIPRGIDPARLEPKVDRAALRRELSTDPDDIAVLYVGSFSPEKRVDRLARVFGDAAGRAPGLTLWVVGDGPDRSVLEDGLQAGDVRGRTTLLGTIEDVGSYMAAADILILTSDTEGLPGVILEAACLGLPCVSTRVGGIADAVQDGTTGLLFDTAQEVEMADAILELAASSETRLQMGQAAKAVFDERFSIASVCDQYLGLYDEVLRPR